MFAILLLTAVSFSGCLNHNHHHGCCHGHGDPNAVYVPLDDEALSAILDGDRILVAASVIPQTEFIERVGGSRVIAISMIPPGGGHTFDPSPRQLTDLSNAVLYMKLDADELFEINHMRTFREINPNMTVVSSSEGITLIQTGRTADPHIWTSPRNAIIMVENTFRGLAMVDPKNEAYFRANADAYIEELKALDAELTDMLSDLSSRNFMVFHPAWGYFARDYNLTQIAIEVDGREPAPRDIVRFINIARENNISVIFVQEQVSMNSAVAIAEGFGGEVYVIDPLAKNYIENLRDVGQVLAQKMA